MGKKKFSIGKLATIPMASSIAFGSTSAIAGAAKAGDIKGMAESGAATAVGVGIGSMAGNMTSKLLDNTFSGLQKTGRKRRR